MNSNIFFFLSTFSFSVVNFHYLNACTCLDLSNFIQSECSFFVALTTCATTGNATKTKVKRYFYLVGVDGCRWHL